MTIISRLTILTISFVISGCSLIATTTQDSKSAASGPFKFFYTKPSLEKNPSEEAIAQVMLHQSSEQFIQTATDSQSLLNTPLNYSRPDPYAKYDEDLYQVLRRNFSFDLSIEDPRISSQLRWYSSHQSYFNRVSDRASRYLFHIVAELQARNMPLELALLPVVESAFDPFAYSHGRAAGMWQFIPETGKMYGLEQNWWYDGRRDVVESTRAALDYLERLNRMFDGDWLLALASYNSGPGTVIKARKRNRAAGKPTDFWNLDLPKETEAYVPKLIALAKIIHAPDDYGITLPYVTTEPFFAIVDTGGQIDLAQAAIMANMELSDLYLLNPGYNRWATDPEGVHKLLVHADKADLFRENIQGLPASERLTWKRYTIESGDSLQTIARKFNVTVDIITDANELSSSLIRIGDKLLIPAASQNDQYYSLSAENRLKVKQNSLSGSNKQRIDYTVQSGDSFWTIARRFDVSVGSLAKWNNMAPKDIIRPGQDMVIWTSPVASSTSGLDNRQVVRKIGYVVRQGDSLYRIAGKFNLQVSDIKKWNTLSSKYLQPGDQLTLFVDVTRIQ